MTPNNLSQHIKVCHIAGIIKKVWLLTATEFCLKMILFAPVDFTVQVKDKGKVCELFELW